MSPARRIYLSDYTCPDFTVTQVRLVIDLDPAATQVYAALSLKRLTSDAAAPIVLNGVDLTVQALTLDGRLLCPADYSYENQLLTIPFSGDTCLLESRVLLHPDQNLALEGLYVAGNILCTQNEAEGFRRITFYPDRPDVLATFTTVLNADQDRYPLLLSNGNLLSTQQLPKGRHQAVWEDPHPKPCYLFALVAGNFDLLSEVHTTPSGKRVSLQIYVDPGDRGRAEFALTSLKKAMDWDEHIYGLVYDLDRYMIVATDAFNGGAMENKGLNIFNSQFVLADPQTATDADYDDIEDVIAHEYFHNYTGNRVTCRDWFQLTLKEGLTVFREQAFSCDQKSRNIQRLHSMITILEQQFPEDAGPNAHPIQPASYQEINNFYTLTVYEKGAEVIRMLHTLLGKSAAMAGVRHYIETYDGKAATTRDFLHAMSVASGQELSDFARWYHQAGTPECQVSWEWHPELSQLALTVKQSCRATPETPEKQPFVFPLALGLMDSNGLPLQFSCTPQEEARSETRSLRISKPEETFILYQVPRTPVPSLLREFSAPVRLSTRHTIEEWALLLAHDTDACVSYLASQQVGFWAIDWLLQQPDLSQVSIPDKIRDAYTRLLQNETLEPALKAELLQIPSLGAISDRLNRYDFHRLYQVQGALLGDITRLNAHLLMTMYHDLTRPAAAPDSFAQRSRRKLKNFILYNLCQSEIPGSLELARQQFISADRMTDQFGALMALVIRPNALGEAALSEFHTRWQHDFLVMTKWLALQAGAPEGPIPEKVRQLAQHPAFDRVNPNKIRSLYRTFAENLVHFHTSEGYNLIADAVIDIDSFNPNLAANLAKSFLLFPRLTGPLHSGMQEALLRIREVSTLSANTREIVANILN